MYPVTDAYKAKMLDQVQTHRLTGTINEVPFTDSDVIGVSYTNRCADKKVTVGSVNIGTLKLTFLTDILDHEKYDGKEITVSDGLLISEDTFEDIPVGTFYTAEAVWTGAGMINITAYDCLSKLDIPLEITQSSGQIYDWASFIALQTGTIFGMTREECAALPNGTELISPYEGSSMETYRDLLSALCQLAGGFAYAAKDGSWKIKSFNNDPVLTIPKNRRMSGATFSDFETYYDGIYYTDVATDIANYVGDDQGLAMKLGSQPFLQYGTVTAKQRRAEAIVEAIKRMKYIPFTVSLLPAFIALDLGDVIPFSDDYTGNTSSGAVMELTWTYNKLFKAKCFGDNPNLHSAESKTDKNISGLIKNTTQNEVTYHTFSNVAELTIEPEIETQIAKLRFISAQKTTVKILHEFIFDMIADLAQDSSYEIRYYLDNELLSYSPHEALKGIYGGQSGDTEFTITRDFFYVLKDVEPNQYHTWEVKILTHNIANTHIDVNHAHVALEGQRMYGEDYFGGFIEAQDNITVIPYGYLGVVPITDSAVVKLFEAPIAIGSDNVGFYDFSSMSVLPIAEGTGDLSPHIYLTPVFGYILTEDGDNLTTENGDRLIL